jgi:hypothetical protein
VCHHPLDPFSPSGSEFNQRMRKWIRCRERERERESKKGEGSMAKVVYTQRESGVVGCAGHKGREQKEGGYASSDLTVMCKIRRCIVLLHLPLLVPLFHTHTLSLCLSLLLLLLLVWYFPY